MIHVLRRRHRRIFLVLALALPLLFLFGLAARKPFTPLEHLPEQVFSPLTIQGPARWTQSVEGLIFSLHQGEPPLLAVTSVSDPRIPDPLLYWSSAAFSSDRPDPDALLLGALGSEGQRVFQLPLAARNGQGVLCVFSPARQQILVQVTLPGAIP